MAEEKKCLVCGKTESEKWIEKQNPIGQRAYFCSKECYLSYKKKAAEKGVCEFC